MKRKTINTEDLNIAIVIDYIKNYCDDNVLYLISDLDNAQHMLHFLEEECFTKREIRDTCFAIKGLRDCLMQAHLQQQGWNDNGLKKQ
jgi:hypothetical protein